MNARRIAMYGFGHLVTDLVSGCIPGLLLLFATTHPDWSYVALTSIWLAMSLSNAIFQPVWGSLADRVDLHLLMPLGLATSAAGIVLVGFADSYALIVAGSAICGLGSSAFHPDAQHAVHQNASTRPGAAMSWFQVAGNFGMSVGPLVVALLTSPTSTAAIGLVGLPALAGSAVLMVDALHRRREEAEKAATRAAGRAAGARAAGARAAAGDEEGSRLPPTFVGTVVRLTGLITMRGFAQTALGTFVALYYQQAFGWSPAAAQYMLFAYLGAGALGTLLGGYLADRIGERRIIALSLGTLVVPALLVRLLPPVPGVACSILCGFVSMASWSVVTVYSQRLYPGHVGMVSGLMTGYTIGMAGISSQVLGLVADTVGLPWVLNLGVLVAIPGALIGWSLPEPRAALGSREARADAAAF